MAGKSPQESFSKIDMRRSSLKIKNVSPGFGLEGGKVYIDGSGFDPEEYGSIQVTFGGVAGRPLMVSKTRIVSEIPENAVPGPVVVSSHQRKSNSFEFVLGRKLSANLNPVDSPVYDKLGNLYATFSGKRGETAPVSVFKITPAGEVSPFLTNIPNATSLAFDRQGNLYISSRFEGTIYRSTPQADVSVFARDLGSPTGIAFDQEGILYVGDRAGRILKVTPKGESSTFAEIPESMVAFHLAFDSQQNLMVSSPGLSSYDHLLLIDRLGKIVPVYGGFGRPQGLAFNGSGDLYVCDAKAGESGVYQIAPTGEVTLLVTGPVLVGVAVDKKGNLAVTSQDSAYYIPLS